MPAPRPSQSAEAARAAALQAEFNEKKWVWVPDDKEGYLAGWVNKEEDDVGVITMAARGEVLLIFAFGNLMDLLMHLGPESSFIRPVQNESPKV
jgi:hypothetical protein